MGQGAQLLAVAVNLSAVLRRLRLGQLHGDDFRFGLEMSGRGFQIEVANRAAHVKCEGQQRQGRHQCEGKAELP